MIIEKTALPGVVVVRPTLYRDGRGYLFESFHSGKYGDAGISGPFVQDNVSQSKRGTLRGLHFQQPHPQGKLITVLRGHIYDVAVDIRTGSDYFGRWVGIGLSDGDHAQLWIPEGFAHGFLVLSETAVIQYKCRGAYVPSSEKTLIWNDRTIGIAWPGEPEIMSPKDRDGRTLEDLRSAGSLPGCEGGS